MYIDLKYLCPIFLFLHHISTWTFANDVLMPQSHLPPDLNLPTSTPSTPLHLQPVYTTPLASPAVGVWRKALTFLLVHLLLALCDRLCKFCQESV